MGRNATGRGYLSQVNNKLSGIWQADSHDLVGSYGPQDHNWNTIYSPQMYFSGNTTSHLFADGLPTMLTFLGPDYSWINSNQSATSNGASNHYGMTETRTGRCGMCKV
jgi:hypothetical protein